MSRPIALTLGVTLAAVAFVSFAGTAEAGCHGGYYGGGHYYKPVYHPIVHRPVYAHRPVVVHKPVVLPVADHCTHPAHRYAWVCVGETLDDICLREYGDASLWPQVAKFNGITSLLTTDRPLQLPVIFTSGKMLPSNAPAPPRPVAAIPAAAPMAALPPAAPSA